MRFLIDECLTIGLVEEARRWGFEAHHLVRLGRAGWRDWNIAAFAMADDFVLVTNNAVDFLQFYARQDVHPGLVLILPSVERAAQLVLFRAALRALKDLPDVVNKVIEASFDGLDTRVRIYDLPNE